MPQEKVLPLPLSGAEIRNAICDRIAQRLAKDGYLNDSLAYDYYSATVKIDLRCHDVGRTAEVKVQETVTAGEESSDAVDISADFDVEAKPPNEERVQTGQSVPVLSRSGDKAEVKGIRYKRPK